MAETGQAERGLRVRAHVADMRDFALPRRYALITIPFNAFLHNLTALDQIATLCRCLAHLEPGWIYPAELELLLRDAGFARWEIYGGFNREPIGASDGLMVAFAWKD